MKQGVFVLLILLSLSHVSQAQYQRWTDIPVTEEGESLLLPFAGGIKNPQFSTIDINRDGLLDLFIFEQSTNRPNIFLNNGQTEGLIYEHAPEYNQLFPSLDSWATCIDYNGDGVEDIFHYTGGSFGVYTGRYENDSWSFELAKEKLKFESTSGILSIYVSAIDIPAIVDVTGDGDIDILTFNSNGGYLEYFENYSQELYGHSDSLVYERLDRCWGEFLEGASGADIELEVGCTGDLAIPMDNGIRHSGSTVLALDRDQDGDMDLILGDVSHPKLIYLENGGNVDNPLMTAQEDFPNEENPIDIHIFPASYQLDVDNDAQKDILVSCKEAVFASNFRDCWRYKLEDGEYTLVEQDFLGGDMIDVGEGAYPVFVDYNNDAVDDLILGNYGYFDRTDSFYNSMLALYENVGTSAEPEYQLITRDFSELSQHNLFGMYPAFADLDEDGDLDMVAGNNAGNLHYFENVAEPGADMFLMAKELDFFDIPNVSYAVPTFYDVDKDGKQDLIVGERQGGLVYLRNVGNANSLNFYFEQYKWGKVDTRQNGYPYGFAAPTIFEQGGEAHLLINTFIGNVFHFKDLELDSFTLVNQFFSDIQEGGQGGVGLTQLNDQQWAVAVGNKRGGIAMFKGDDITSTERKEISNSIDFYPNPASDHLQVALQSGDQFLQLLDVAGRVVLEQDLRGLSNQAKVDVKGLNPGVYFLQIAQEKSRRTAKLILQE